ncbi:MAG: S41 family peptidase [Candidatus Paceibacterota bacterium]
MKIKKILDSKIVLFVCILIFAGSAFYAGFYFGEKTIPEIDKVEGLISKEKGIEENIDFSEFWAVWNLLNENFVSSTTTKATNQEKVWGAIKGLTESLGDPYTVFFPPKEAEIFKTSIDGNFSGVGMEIAVKDNQLVVMAPLKGTPAEKVGMRSGDKIMSVDGKSTTGLNVEEAVQMIRGEKGTRVKLTVVRNGGKSFDVEIIRDTINIPTIDTKLREDGVFVLSLYNFSAVSPNLFRDGIKEFVDSGSSKLVLDLRGNTGGYLEAAVDMASWFLPSGKIVVTEDFGEKNKDKNRIHRSSGHNIFNENLKMIILVDSGTASASEILAGALKEHGIAELVGVNTFGKGSVQELVGVGAKKASIKITVARWLTPNGNSISENGLTPDYKVEYTNENKEKGIDPQMEKAASLLLVK